MSPARLAVARGHRAAAPGRLAVAQGIFNVVSGVWPLLHMRSFEAVSGPKVDRWLVRTVGGLLVTNGVVQISAARSPATHGLARTIGVGTALTLGGIDVAYAPPGRISRVYLADALVELGWVLAWSATRRVRPEP